MADPVPDIAQAVDLRLADVWADLFRVGAALDGETVGWLLRAAYARGYRDALADGDPGVLLAEAGGMPHAPAPGRPPPVG